MAKKNPYQKHKIHTMNIPLSPATLDAIEELQDWERRSLNSNMPISPPLPLDETKEDMSQQGGDYRIMGNYR